MNRMKLSAAALLLAAALLPGALAACGQSTAPPAGSGAAQGQSTPQSGGGAPVPPSQSAPADEPEPAGAAGQALSEEELDSLWQALGLGQSAWWCADDESVTWGGLGWPAFWVSQQQDGGRSVKYGSAWGSGVTELVLAGAEHDGTGGYVLTFSGYVRDDGVAGAFAGGAPVLAVSLNGGETLEASMAGEGFDGVPHTHTLIQAKAVGRLEGYDA